LACGIAPGRRCDVEGEAAGRAFWRPPQLEFNLNGSDGAQTHRRAGDESIRGQQQKENHRSLK